MIVDADGDGYDSSVDCDDNDAWLNWDDVDGDGYSSCDGDCDDDNWDLDPADYDGDGLSSCDGDCDDWDADYTTVCTPASCADLLADDPTSGDGVYSIDYGDGAMDLYCDMTGGGITIENFGFGPYTDSFTGWEWLNHDEFTGYAVSDAMAYFYNENVGLWNLSPGFTSNNCCLISNDSTESTYYGFAGNTYMYPADADGSENCNSTYNDSYMLLYGGSDTSISYSSLTQAEIQAVESSTACATSGNPTLFIYRW
jgi:hypothetical protein